MKINTITEDTRMTMVNFELIKNSPLEKEEHELDMKFKTTIVADGVEYIVVVDLKQNAEDEFLFAPKCTAPKPLPEGVKHLEMFALNCIAIVVEDLMDQAEQQAELATKH